MSSQVKIKPVAFSHRRKVTSRSRPIGKRSVGAIGFGPMRCSYEPLPDRPTAIRAIHAALDHGATLIDTADCYAPSAELMHHNEQLIAEALKSWSGARSAILVATKAGHVRAPTSIWEHRGDARHLRAACERSLRILGGDTIGLFQLHSPDPSIPFADQIGELGRLRDEGKIEEVGLCNVGRSQLAAAAAILPIASVQNRYSLRVRSAANTLGQCEDDGVAFLAWSPLDPGEATLRSIDTIARSRQVSPQRIALAYLIDHSPALIPLVGATRPATARDSLAAAELVLSEHEILAIDAELGSAAPLSGPCGDRRWDMKDRK